ncbi:MAG TPA: CopG family antitoxin [Candidatus Nanopelagicales bacterium]|jgi:predicted DNA-binding protein
MKMTKRTEHLPRPTAELEQLAEYYDSHDTGSEMEDGQWVDPQPMRTTSLRLPVEVIDQLKRQARGQHVRYTSYVRSILEQAALGEPSSELAQITERLDRIERMVTDKQSRRPGKTA